MRRGGGKRRNQRGGAGGGANSGLLVAPTAWLQGEVTVSAPGRGCSLITEEILAAVPQLGAFRVGELTAFCKHTSASLTINENCDPTVREDMDTALSRIVPDAWSRDGTFKHTMEGDDDMPAHVRSTLTGSTVTIPVSNGQLALGTWQGVYLCEHRTGGGWGGGHSRDIVVTVKGVVDEAEAAAASEEAQSSSSSSSSSTATEAKA